jgi:hypothetical protein
MLRALEIRERPTTRAHRRPLDSRVLKALNTQNDNGTDADSGSSADEDHSVPCISKPLLSSSDPIPPSTTQKPCCSTTPCSAPLRLALAIPDLPTHERAVTRRERNRYRFGQPIKENAVRTVLISTGTSPLALPQKQAITR